MRRRNITIRGQSLERQRRSFQEMKEKLRQKFNDDEESLDRMLTHLMYSGFDMEDMYSFNLQADNKKRPPVEAFLFHNEHILDQMFLTQGTYTNFNDNAINPNYALRHKGQTELILRRMTPGDLLLLQAAQTQGSRVASWMPSSDQPDYWRCIWYEVVLKLVPSKHRAKLSWLFEGLKASASAVMFFAENSMKYDEANLPVHLHDAFLDPSSPFYCGVKVHFENRRDGDRFKSGWFFDRIDNGDESLAMFCSVVAAYGIDNYARATMDGLRSLPIGDNFYTIFTNYLVQLPGPTPYFEMEEDNADQTAIREHSRDSSES